MKRIFSNKELEFFKKNIKHLEEKLEIMNMSDEELIGREVISIRSGFGTIDGGQKMIVSSIYYFGDKKIKTFELRPIKESQSVYPNHPGWSSICTNKHYDFILWDRNKKYKFQ